MIALYNLLNAVVNLLVYIIVIQAILSWLLAFNVINGYNRFVGFVWNVSNRLTEPLLAPIRRIIPSIGGIDLSPIVLILALFFMRDLILQYLVAPQYGMGNPVMPGRY